MCLDTTLKQFWEVEEIPNQIIRSAEDNFVEQFFTETYKRTESGRFVVKLPFKDNSSSLTRTFTDSIEIADRRLIALERRLNREPHVKNLYHQFMNDYLESGHMSAIATPTDPTQCYFIPHHAVFRSGESDKIRVVFDASTAPSIGKSLNSLLSAGPKLQSDINVILLRFRSFAFVMTSDIRQMYRQIEVATDDRKYQLIRFRFSPTDSIQTFQLNPVTYGLSASPYLAIRCLHELATIGETQYPLAAQAIRSGLYVDDFAIGSNSLETAHELQHQLISLLETGKFELRKWSANHPSLLKNLDSNHCRVDPLTFDDDTKSTLKILGLTWNPTRDCFSFLVNPCHSQCTKLSILSDIARIFDPVGFLSPATILAKHLIQELWSLGLNWDTIPPQTIVERWTRFKMSLPELSSLEIPRYLKSFQSQSRHCELHAFCDASEVGYAAVVYFRFLLEDGNYHTSLVFAKSKVAPLKRLSIPRLELCAAVLLAKSVEFVISSCSSNFTFDKIVAWSDSTVALSWIRSSPHLWKTFVAHRVSYIQDHVSPESWRHVSSGDNPADPASRGLFPSDLRHCSLWWAGPPWLIQDINNWPNQPQQSTTCVEEARPAVVCVVQSSKFLVEELIERFSSFSKVVRVLAYVYRFCRSHKSATLAISSIEFDHCTQIIIKQIQSKAFKHELARIRNDEPCPKSFRKLSPFVDEAGILRVGGRLCNASLPFETKHPMLLPKNHRITNLIVREIHHRNFHPGVNTTLYLIQQRYWIISTRAVIRSVLSKCYRCFRAKPVSVQPAMAALPFARVSQLKPFTHVGVDYGGPLSIVPVRRRGAKVLKAYICLFICFSTKAIHIEIASDLSTETFLAALRRFVARRCRCSHLYSDCGTNFVGAYCELNSHFKVAAERTGIQWHFNPPSAPHFGGLWEAGIKSVKSHIARVIGLQILTYEELNTLVIQIEAVLNSRPLYTTSSDPNDMNVPTPGHFLTLEPLTAPPDPSLDLVRISSLLRWQLIQRMHQGFWNRWRNEYFHTLYQKGKWAKSNSLEGPDIGAVVIIKNELLPPLEWKLGRICELHPGRDGIARVATVRTQSSKLLKRPCVKLCPIPLHDS